MADPRRSTCSRYTSVRHSQRIRIRSFFHQRRRDSRQPCYHTGGTSWTCPDVIVTLGKSCSGRPSLPVKRLAPVCCWIHTFRDRAPKGPQSRISPSQYQYVAPVLVEFRNGTAGPVLARVRRSLQGDGPTRSPGHCRSTSDASIGTGGGTSVDLHVDSPNVFALTRSDRSPPVRAGTGILGWV